MMTVETIGRIRRAYLVERESIRGIARRLRVSRQVVRRAIACETGEFHYERSVQPLPKLGSHVAELSRLLEENERRSQRERLTLIRVWEELRELGYAGGYDAVRRYARRWQRARGAQIAEAFVDRRPIPDHIGTHAAPSLPALRFAARLQPWRCLVTT